MSFQMRVLYSTALLITLTWLGVQSSLMTSNESQSNLFFDENLDLLVKKFFSSLVNDTELPEIRQLRNNYASIKELLEDIKDLPRGSGFVDLLIKQTNWSKEDAVSISHPCNKEPSICNSCPKKGDLVKRFCDKKCAKLNREVSNGTGCNEEDLSKCPTCPIPIWCPPVPENETCPPKPICPQNLCDMLHKRSSIPIASEESKHFCSTKNHKSKQAEDAIKRARCKWLLDGEKSFGGVIRVGLADSNRHVNRMMRKRKRNHAIERSTTAKILDLIGKVRMSASDWPARIGRAFSQTIGGTLIEILGDVKDSETSLIFWSADKTFNSGGTNLFYANKFYAAIRLEAGRRECGCPQCELFSKHVHCDCRKSNYNIMFNDSALVCPSARICLPCQPENLCPVPIGCPANPMCQECGELKLSGYIADDPELIGLLDDEDLVGKEELEKPFGIPEKCQFCDDFKSCGKAPLNRLSKSNYSHKIKTKKRIQGGSRGRENYWPSFVSLRIKAAKNGIGCGGVLVSRRHVLTAAHCISMIHLSQDSQDRVDVITGEFKPPISMDISQTKAEQKHHVANICRLNKYKETQVGRGVYDFALLTLENDIKFNDKVQPACLPHDMSLFSRSPCFIMGLGNIADIWNVSTPVSKGAGVILPEVFQEMQVKRSPCNNLLISESDRSRHCFSKVNGPGSACGGDSGGPILCEDDSGRWTVVGLGSYANGQSCDGEAPSGWNFVYTRLPTMLEVINEECKLFA